MRTRKAKPRLVLPLLAAASSVHLLFLRFAHADEDKGDHCDHWASTGECENNWSFMATNCPRACKKIQDSKQAEVDEKLRLAEEKVKQLEAQQANGGLLAGDVTASAGAAAHQNAEQQPGTANVESSSKILAMRQEIAQLKAEVEGAEAKFLTEKNGLQQLHEEQLQGMQKELEAAKGDQTCQIAVTERDQLVLKNEELTQQRDAARQQGQELQGQVEQLQAQVREFEQKQQQTSTEEEFTTKITNLEQDKVQLKQQLVEKEDEMRNITDISEHCHQQLEEKAGKHSELALENDQLRGELQQAKLELANKTAELSVASSKAATGATSVEASTKACPVCPEEKVCPACSSTADSSAKEKEQPNKECPVCEQCDLAHCPACPPPPPPCPPPVKCIEAEKNELQAEAKEVEKTCPACPPPAPAPPCPAVAPAPAVAEGQETSGSSSASCPAPAPCRPPPAPATECNCPEQKPCPPENVCPPEKICPELPPQEQQPCNCTAAVEEAIQAADEQAKKAASNEVAPSCSSELFQQKRKLEAEHQEAIQKIKNTQDAVGQQRIDDNAELGQELQRAKESLESCEGKRQFFEKKVNTLETEGIAGAANCDDVREEYEKKAEQLLHEKNLWIDTNRTLSADLENCNKQLDQQRPVAENCNTDLKKKQEEAQALSAQVLGLEEEKNRFAQSSNEQQQRLAQLQQNLEAERQKSTDAEALQQSLAEEKRLRQELEHDYEEKLVHLSSQESVSAENCAKKIKNFASAKFVLLSSTKLVTFLVELVWFNGLEPALKKLKVLETPESIATALGTPALNVEQDYIYPAFNKIADLTAVQRERFSPLLDQFNTVHVNEFVEKKVKMPNFNVEQDLPAEFFDRLVLVFFLYAVTAFLLFKVVLKVLCCQCSVVGLLSCGLLGDCCARRKKADWEKKIEQLQQNYYANQPPYGCVRIEIVKIEKFVMRKMDASWSLSFQVAHDKFRDHQNPACHAVWAKQIAPVMLLWQHIVYP
ncbi:unnamed protein product [Amoebophrya sp. A120]|nr:unnamed protein product [Amoebophrya sp. A120]|eukprot:GSA120T00004581001.1